MTQLCFKTDELNAFLLGKMASEERLEAVAGHLEGCGRCQSAADSMERTRDSILEGLQSPSRTDSFFNDSGILPFLNRAKNLVRPAVSVAPSYAEATIDFLPNGGQIRDCKLLHPIGHGGMGTVYKANHMVLGRTVAVKVLPPNRMDEPQAVARFQKEMQAVGQVNHPHIVHAHDAGIENGVHFLVMEYVEGADLKQVIRNQMPFSIADACEVIRQAALGLQGVMKHGLVHRDVKPSNLMLTPDRKIKILDLGLARLAPSPTSAKPVLDETLSGTMLGTVDYMAPEQIEASDRADIRSDIYGLGCTFYHLLAGRVPFAGDVSEKLDAHRMQEPTPLDAVRSDIPKGLAEVVQKMMRKNPNERFANPQAVADAVTPYCGSARLDMLLRNAKARPVSLAQPANIRRRRTIWLAVGVAAACLLLAAFFILRVRTQYGTLVIEFPAGVPQNVQVYVDGDKAVVERIDGSKAKIVVAAGKQREVIVKQGNKVLQKKMVSVDKKGIPAMVVRMEKGPPLAKVDPVPKTNRIDLKNVLPKPIYSKEELKKKQHADKLILETTTKLGVRNNIVVADLGPHYPGIINRSKYRDIARITKSGPLAGIFLAWEAGPIVIIPPEMLHSVVAKDKAQQVTLTNGETFTGILKNNITGEDGHVYSLSSAKKIVAIRPKSWNKNAELKTAKAKWNMQFKGIEKRKFKIYKAEFWYDSQQGVARYGETFAVSVDGESVQGHLSKFDRVQVEGKHKYWRVTVKPPQGPPVSGGFSVISVDPHQTDWYLLSHSVEGYVFMAWTFILEKEKPQRPDPRPLEN